ncbi:MAG: hypothetical protein JRF64_04760 [Deltaproteobacteria bacterium]|nr:hypothetical protein [Deltaproteobacteria bacterium]
MPEKKSFPKRVSIENMNACNTRRTTCPREKLTSKLQLMDIETLEGLLKESIEA